MFAQSILDFSVSDGIYFFVRVIATVGGAVVGWFATDPLTRMVYRLSFKGVTPMYVLLIAKIAGAATLALLIWFFLPLGGGGGLGWGAGPGGSPGKGPGQGGNKGPGTEPNTKDGKDTKNAKDPKGDTTPKVEPHREPVKVEILGGPRFKNDGEERFYLVLRKDESARSLKELEEYLKKNPPSLIEIIHTDDTFVVNTDEDPTRRLRKLGIPTKGPAD